jgi:cephalosporin-C deacetylase-like acetyl esterase
MMWTTLQPRARGVAFASILAVAASITDIANAEETSSPERFGTIDELWADFDPRRDPLEIEIISTSSAEGSEVQELYFTGETWQGEKTRVYAIQGAPTSTEKLPGILHVHGGGQTASKTWVQYWTQRGYVCVTYDFCGDWREHDPGRTHFTKWGTVRGNMARLGGNGSLAPTPKFNGWYHWIMAARRALTLLEQHPSVDRDRLGIFGISVGGTLTWPVAALDVRFRQRNLPLRRRHDFRTTQRADRDLACRQTDSGVASDH